MDTHLRKVLGSQYDKVRSSKVLMVGAGGIGCELLKNLLLTGYGEIHIVDLDTITLSNLNRQFLFRQKDIGQSKSLTVARAVEQFNYFNAKLVSHDGNVMNLDLFPIEWWDQFDAIYNALDNLEARRYVNRMALFLRKFLMESGTTGFDGQVQPIVPYTTECFECQPKATPTTYPVCTIRSTPSQPVHCIVWAKEYLFSQLFDEVENPATEADLQAETDDQEEICRIVAEANELAALRAAILENGFAMRLLRKIFSDDVKKALRLETLWKTRARPEPLDVDALVPQLEKLSSVSLSDTNLWSVEENVHVLIRATEALQRRVAAGEGPISFDKDDEDALDFMSATANLRAHVFHIPMLTKFDIKQIGGNIIPAIATTNAIVSGLSLLGALSHNAGADLKTIFLSLKHNKRATAAAVETPNKLCASCGTLKKGIAVLSPETLKKSLSDFIGEVNKKYGFEEVSVILGKDRLIYDYDFDDNAETPLSEIKGMTENEVMLILDENEELQSLEFLIKFGENTKLPELKLEPRAKPAPPEEDTSTIEVDEEPPSKKRKTAIELD